MIVSEIITFLAAYDTGCPLLITAKGLIVVIDLYKYVLFPLASNFKTLF